MPTAPGAASGRASDPDRYPSARSFFAYSFACAGLISSAATRRTEIPGKTSREGTGFNPRKAAAIAKAGIYDIRIHRDEVLMPIIKYWRIFDLTGLDVGSTDGRERLGLGLATKHRQRLNAARKAGFAVAAIEDACRGIDVGGERGRKVVFDVRTGSAWVRRLRWLRGSAVAGLAPQPPRCESRLGLATAPSMLWVPGAYSMPGPAA